MPRSIDDNKDSPRPAEARHAPGAYSILMLFYLTSLAAIIVAACRMAFENASITGQGFAAGAIGLGVLGFIGGSFLGFFIGRNAASVSIGAVVGASFGPVATGLAAINSSDFASLNILIFTGCWIIILIALVANRLQTQSS